MRAFLVLVVLVACGGKTPPHEQVIGNTPPDAGPIARAAECPASFGDAHQCEQNSSLSCTYPEGSCWCGIDMPCTGVDLGDEWYASQPTQWQCHPNPPLVRADGCPGTEPSGPCGDEGKSCTYGDCCVQTITCQGGQWQMGMASCPP